MHLRFATLNINTQFWIYGILNIPFCTLSTLKVSSRYPKPWYNFVVFAYSNPNQGMLTWDLVFIFSLSIFLWWTFSIDIISKTIYPVEYSLFPKKKSPKIELKEKKIIMFLHIVQISSQDIKGF